MNPWSRTRVGAPGGPAISRTNVVPRPASGTRRPNGTAGPTRPSSRTTGNGTASPTTSRIKIRSRTLHVPPSITRRHHAVTNPSLVRDKTVRLYRNQASANMLEVVPRQFGEEVWLRFSWAMTYRMSTVVGAGVLALLAFSQGSQWWDLVGAVLTGSAIADVILLIAAAWFRWRHRSEL